MTRHARAVTGSAIVGALALTLVLMVLVLGAGRSPAGAVPAERAAHPEYGHTFAKNGVLKRGCHTYRYRYSITPPPGDWALETFIIGPHHVHLASDAFAIGLDQKQGTAKYRICKPSTQPGIFKIRAKISSQDGSDLIEGWLPVTRYRLRQPS